jgi:NitT/TauT family transport system substrate-binding protein
MKAHTPQTSRLSRFLAASALIAASCFALLSVGCPKKNEGPSKLKVAYLGLTCEAPIFAALENGYYKEEGLEVELVKTDWDGLREGLSLGTFDANHTLIMYLLKPIEQGMDVKITGGIHTGCLRVQAGRESDIKTIKDLKGKRIGVPTHIGSPPYLFASRVLARNEIDPSPEAKQVTWLAFPPDVLGKALSDGRIDAVATSDPIGTILLGKKLVRNIADQAVDKPYCDEFCCAAVVSGKLARENPEAAAKVTRALLRGAKWVHENPKAAAKIGVDKKYIAASIEINSQALSKLKYIPAVTRCKKNIEEAAKEMKAAGLLKPATDPAKLAKRAWLDLPGVNDEAVAMMKVDKVPGGGRPKILEPDQFAALFGQPKDKDGNCSCCCKCCLDR